jgi:hypothetical protein
MKSKWIQRTGMAAAFVLASAARAQTDLNPPGPDRVFFFKTTSERGGMELKAIKGAPYSAEQTTTTTQTLADGNRIVQTSTAKVYRDGQGRSRVEQSFGSIGALASAGKHSMIMINDAVAGVRYNLRPESHTADKMPSVGPPPPPLPPDPDKIRAEKRARDTSQVFFSSDVRAEGTAGVVTYDAPPPGIKTNDENLGPQTMEGLSVTGTRKTVTIPAGAEGNELPMQIVDERWYSPDLQTNLKTIHTDPRMGQTVFTVTNVSRANPDASLFQVPADYQITDGPAEPHLSLDLAGPPPNQ